MGSPDRDALLISIVRSNSRRNRRTGMCLPEEKKRKWNEMNDTYRSVDDAAYIQLRHNFMYTEKINKIEHIK